MDQFKGMITIRMNKSYGFKLKELITDFVTPLDNFESKITVRVEDNSELVLGEFIGHFVDIHHVINWLKNACKEAGIKTFEEVG